VVSLTHPAVWVTATAGAVLLASGLLFLIGGYVGIMRRRTGAPVPEGNRKFWTGLYTAASIRQYLGSAGKGGWHAYRLALWWDVVFSAMFGLFGLVLVNGLFGATRDVSRALVDLFALVPVAAAGVDIVEDLLLLYAVGVASVPAGGELPHPEVIMVAVWFTRTKFVLYAVAFGVMASGGVTLVVRGSG
jgi:hypothetical protein